MGTLFVGTLRALLREKGLFIWSLAFPMLMATIFMFMFAGIDDATAFDPVPTAVVTDEAWEASPFAKVVEALGEPGDDQLLDVRSFADSSEALHALTSGEVMGVLSVDGGGEPELALSPGLQIGASTSADAVNRSILESVVTAYVRDADLMTSLAMADPTLLAEPDRLAAAFSGGDTTEEVSLTRSAPAQTVRFYYALFAMAALFGPRLPCSPSAGPSRICRLWAHVGRWEPSGARAP